MLFLNYLVIIVSLNHLKVFLTKRLPPLFFANNNTVYAKNL